MRDLAGCLPKLSLKTKSSKDGIISWGERSTF